MSRRLDRLAEPGFTFVEILAAMLFMAIVIPVAMRGILLSNTVSERGERKRLAAELADALLDEAILTESWREGDQNGDFEDDWPGTRWTVTSESWSEDTMRIVRASVTYSVQDHEFTETVYTLADEWEEDEEEVDE